MPDALFNDQEMFQKLDGLTNLSLINDAIWHLFIHGS